MVTAAGAGRGGGRAAPVYAALDLGTNNLRLLIARPAPGGHRVVEAFSRITRLGEGLAADGALRDAAVERTLGALDVCAARMSARRVTRSALVATEACRSASNGAAFVAAARARTGLALRVVGREEEARLAAAGCAALVDPAAGGAVLFDIGGGSTEVVWLAGGRGPVAGRVRAWTSLPIGVVTLAERRGGRAVDGALYGAMVEEVAALLAPFAARAWGAAGAPGFHLLGTSGTVTTVAGVHLGLARYDRARVDGLWLARAEALAAIDRLRGMDHAGRAAHPCVGEGRADLVLAGCAIYEALARAFPCERLRVADRGVREGLLLGMLEEDGLLDAGGTGASETGASEGAAA